MGAPKTFGAPGQEARQQQQTGSDPEHWQARFREYPTGPEGHLEYDQGHRHGDEDEAWPLGSPPGEAGE